MKKNSIQTLQPKPFKQFVFEKFDRDHSYIGAIMDLIDNCFDASKRNKKEKFKIDILITKNRFVIQDTCGGLPLKDATTSAFRFGMPKKDAPGSAFGLGLKVSMLKFGDDYTFLSSMENNEFIVHLKSVQEWIHNNDWGIPIENIDYPLSFKDGVTIDIKNLREKTQKVFTDRKFKIALGREIDLSKFSIGGNSARNVAITINKKSIFYWSSLSKS